MGMGRTYLRMGRYTSGFRDGVHLERIDLGMKIRDLETRIHLGMERTHLGIGIRDRGIKLVRTDLGMGIRDLGMEDIPGDWGEGVGDRPGDGDQRSRDRRHVGVVGGGG